MKGTIDLYKAVNDHAFARHMSDVVQSDAIGLTKT